MDDPTPPTIWTDERIGAVLSSFKDDLELVAAASRRRSRLPPRRARVVVAVVALAATVSTVVAPVRQAVADWLGIGSTRIEVLDHEDPSVDLGSLPWLADGGAVISAEAAAAVLGRSLPWSSTFGPPDAVLGPPEGGVVLTWRDGATTLWIRREDDAPILVVKKLIRPEARVVAVPALGDDALAVIGAHTVLTPMRRIAASNVVLWTSHGWELRLESELAETDLIDLARSLRV